MPEHSRNTELRSTELFASELFQEDGGPPLAEAVLAEVPSDEPGRDDKPVKKRQIGFWLAIGWLAVLTFCAVFAAWLPFVQEPNRITPQFRQPPSAEHWFGTDSIGRDLFARTVYGARVSLAIAGASIFFGLLFGGIFGLITGYFRGRLDSVMSVVIDIMLAFPALILLLVITSFLGRSALYVVLALTVLSIPPLTRIVRATTMVFSQREFVLAARSLGAKNGRVLVKEILPNVVPSMLSFALTGLAVLIIAEGALAFLGQSVPPPQPTWGLIINEGREFLEVAWWISLIPAAVLFLTVLSFNLIGDVLAKRFEIRESSL
jgi:peptide/nickel transport system permease protein